MEQAERAKPAITELCPGLFLAEEVPDEEMLSSGEYLVISDFQNACDTTDQPTTSGSLVFGRLCRALARDYPDVAEALFGDVVAYYITRNKEKLLLSTQAVHDLYKARDLPGMSYKSQCLIRVVLFDEAAAVDESLEIQ